MGSFSPSFYALVHGSDESEKFDMLFRENRKLERAKMTQDSVVRRLKRRVEQLAVDLRLSHEEKGRLIVSCTQ